MANETHKTLVTLTTLFKIFSYICFTVQQPHSTRKLHIAAIVSFFPPDCVIKVARIANYKEHKASPKLANMATQPSPPTSELPFGLQNINNMNKLSGVKCFLK
jgi:hypothetical protein